MNASNKKGPLVDPGLCRCCGSTKKCRILNAEYEWIGHKEIYSDMFVDTFGLLLSNLDGQPPERLICATCVSRLRDASAFRKQVLCCEETLLQARLDTESTIQEIKQEMEVDDSKQEVSCVTMQPPEYSYQDNYESEQHHSEDSNDSIPAKPPPKKTPKKIKKEKKTKQTNRRLTIKKKMKQKRKDDIEAIEAQILAEEIDLLEAVPKPRPKPTEAEQHSLHNTLTVVECSFVCPFDSSFSDYVCVYCRATFGDADTLRRHTAQHDPTNYKQVHNNKKLTQIDITRIDCRLCPETIHNLQHLKEHLSNAHGKLIYPTANEFLKFRLTNKSLSCTECGSDFSFFHALKKHMAEHFGTCICDVCGAHYFEERMLLLHQKTHQKVDEIYPCAECGKNFKSKHSRYLHEARTHKKEPAYQCPKCDEVLFSYSLRYRHIIEVHGDRRMYQCSHCDRSYDSRKSLREHNRRYHLKIFKHQCDLCDKRFYIPSRLKEHLATHTGERNYRCDLCGKSYPRLRGLKVHLQSHSNEKKFRCVMCNAAFTQNVNLKNHIKRQHQGLDVEEGFRE